MSQIVKNVLGLYTFMVTGWSLKLFVSAAQAKEKSNTGLTYGQLADASLLWKEALTLRVPRESNWAIELNCKMNGTPFLFTLTFKHIGVSDKTHALTIKEIQDGIKKDCRNTPFRDFLEGAFFGRGVNWEMHNVRGLFQEAGGRMVFRCTDGTKKAGGYTQIPVYSDDSFDITGGVEDIYEPFKAEKFKFLPPAVREKSFSNLNSTASVLVKGQSSSKPLIGREAAPTQNEDKPILPSPVAEIEI